MSGPTGSLSGKVIAITGAGQGIGAAAARHLAQRGAHLLLGARRRDRLEDLLAEIRFYGGSAELHPLESDDPHETAAFVEAGLHRLGRLDALVGEAGLQGLPALHRQGFGQVVHVGAASAGLRALCQALRQAHEAIRVTMICPPAQGSMPAEAIARAIGFAVAQPEELEVNEITLKAVH